MVKQILAIVMTRSVSCYIAQELRLFLHWFMTTAMLNKVKENEISKKRLSKGNIPIPKDLVLIVFIPRPHHASIFCSKSPTGTPKHIVKSVQN